MSLVTRCCRKSRLSSPAIRNRPICETSNRAADLRTAKCSSRIEVYCCGISHPPKSTMRPPRETWRSLGGVRFRGLFAVNRVVGVDGVGGDEPPQLLVVAAPRLAHPLGHLTGPLHPSLQ